MKSGFNLEELEKNNVQSIRVIKGFYLVNSIFFQFFGLINGIIEEKDIYEELLKWKERKQEEREDDKDSDQEIVDEEVDENSLGMFVVEEIGEVLFEEIIVGEQFIRFFILDKIIEEDDVYDFSIDYV